MFWITFMPKRFMGKMVVFFRPKLFLENTNMFQISPRKINHFFLVTEPFPQGVVPTIFFLRKNVFKRSKHPCSSNNISIPQKYGCIYTREHGSWLPLGTQSFPQKDFPK